MYGLLFVNLGEYISTAFGEKKWKEIRESCKVETETFDATAIMPEGQLQKIGKKAQSILGMKEEEFYEGMGVYFVTLANNLGYTQMISLVGRHLRDFFLNLDNLHDYLKLTFPRMKAPSFFIEEESNDGAKIQYRSKRRGFHFYVQGQVKEICKKIFKIFKDF